MNKKIVVFAVILFAAVSFLYCYMTSSDLQAWIATYTEEDFSQDNIYSDLNSLSERLQKELMDGSESFIVYLKDMDIDEIYQINELSDGVFGGGDTYQQVKMVGNHYRKVEMTVRRTPNYYVLKAYQNKESIPDTERKAQELYVMVSDIMDSWITESMTDFEKEVVLHDYLVKHCRYSQNTSQSVESDIYRAYGALVNRDAVCNGYAEALQLLLLCAGVESKMVTGTANGIEHAWNLVRLDGMWYHLDATWNDPLPDKGEVVNHPYFNVADDMISNSHTWDKEQYPEAVSMKYNYYVYHNSYFEDFESYKAQAYDVMIHEQQNCYEAMLHSYSENEEAMQFVFEDNHLYSNVNWQTFQVGDNSVLILQAE